MISMISDGMIIVFNDDGERWSTSQPSYLHVGPILSAKLQPNFLHALSAAKRDA